jgi:hypothetical protein
MASCQFYGLEPVMAEYSRRDISVWAVFDGKELNASGDDAESLRAYLVSLAPGGTAAPYTLRFYPNLDSGDDVTPKSEYNGCFKFKLTEAGTMGVVGATRYAGVDPIYQKIQGVITEEVGKAIDKRLNGKGDEELESWGDKIGNALVGLINQPEKLINIIGTVKHLWNSGGSLPAALAGVAEPARRAGSTQQPEPMDNEQIERLGKAIDRLEKQDAGIVRHLEQLADLAEKKPALFKMLLAQLEGGI